MPVLDMLRIMSPFIALIVGCFAVDIIQKGTWRR